MNVRAARLGRPDRVAHASLFQRTAECDVLLGKLEQAHTVRRHLADLEAYLATVPAITSSQLKSVQKLENRCSNAEAALQAMAAGIEVLASDWVVQVGDKTLHVGQSEVLTEDTEIAIGTSIRLRVKPGGGNSLADARAQLHDAHHALQQSLDKFGINSTTAAAESLTRRQQLETDIKADQAELAGLGADTIDNDVAEARNLQLAAEADVKQRASLVGQFTPPLGAGDAHTLVAQWAEQLHDAESRESSCKRTHATSPPRTRRTWPYALHDHRQTVQKEELHLRDLKVQVGVLLGDHGEDADRSSKLTTLLADRVAAENRSADTGKALDALQPDMLESDRVRLTRAITQCDSDKHEAEKKLAVAKNILRSDGSVDPQAACDLAQARLRAADDRLASCQRRAQAVTLLHELFLDEQCALADQFTRPFAEKITLYLQCLFVRVREPMCGSKTTPLPGWSSFGPNRRGAFLFDSLSAGTKEQVAAAVRLAIAEVLAESSDNCLPVVFDDAFAYSDPDRVSDSPTYARSGRGLRSPGHRAELQPIRLRHARS